LLCGLRSVALGRNDRELSDRIACEREVEAKLKRVGQAGLVVAEGWPATNDLSAFDGDAERERQICDLRIRGKTEAEVCQMLGCTVPDIHRALDRAAQAAMTPVARVRSIYIDAARLERIQQVFLPLVESADDKAALTIIRAQERSAALSRQKSIGDFRRRIRPSALVIREQKQGSSQWARTADRPCPCEAQDRPGSPR
jgi:hypothetical protein